MNSFENSTSFTWKKIPTIKNLFLIAFLFLYGSLTMQAQNCNCTQHITGIDQGNYTVIAGQVLCIDSGAVEYGNVTMNGGILCINGSFKGGLTSNSSIGGSFIKVNAGGVIAGISNFSIASSSVIIEDQGVFNVFGDLSLMGSGSYLTNNGVINVQGVLKLNQGAVLLNNRIINYSTLEMNGGTLNGDGKMNVIAN